MTTARVPWDLLDRDVLTRGGRFAIGWHGELVPITVWGYVGCEAFLAALGGGGLWWNQVLAWAREQGYEVDRDHVVVRRDEPGLVGALPWQRGVITDDVRREMVEDLVAEWRIARSVLAAGAT